MIDKRLTVVVVLALLAASLPVEAQPPKKVRIGYLSGNPPSDTKDAFDALLQVGFWVSPLLLAGITLKPKRWPVIIVVVAIAGALVARWYFGEIMLPFDTSGTWNTDGVIVFAPSGGRPLFQIAATGGEPATLTQLDEPKQGSHRYPQFLPDGRHFLYYAQGSPEASGVYVSNLDRSVTLRLVAADGGAVYASGHLLFVRQGVLFAQAFDLSSFALTGEPIAVAEQLAVDNEDTVALSASAVGPIVFRTGSIRGLRQLA